MTAPRPRWISLLASLLLLAIASSLAADKSSPRTPEQMKASFDAHKADFDYLLGDWQFTSDSQQYGKGHGTWTAVKLADGQVIDEFRILGDKGEIYYSSVTLRAYNAAADQWELVTADHGTGLQNLGTARKEGAEIHITQTFGAATGKPSVMRIRYYDIGPDRFSWTADRSSDGGKTWLKQAQRIEARRVGPPHSAGLFGDQTQ